MIVIIVIGSYLAIGYLLHYIFPEKKPPVTGYFKPGYQFYSKVEGVRQTVIKQENGFVYCDAVVEPFAAGPPKHTHTDFDETFEIANGELSVWLDGKVVKLHPGEKLFVPKGMPHKPFNETSETIRMKHAVAFPEKFAYHLAQVYGVMENTPGFGKSPGTMLQMGLFASEGFDSYLAGDAPPVIVQKITGFVTLPLARLMGYKSFYPAYDIRKKY